MVNPNDVPDYDSLPPVEGMPRGCAWGVFDRDGEKDILGCLNLLTTDVIKSAYLEARDGVTISLNWPMDSLHIPGHRKGLNHRIIHWKDPPTPGGFHADSYDDEVDFNTQCSSQWDGLAHFMHQASGRGYNHAVVTKEKLEMQGHGIVPGPCLPTLDHWHDKGGVVGRGVLLDYRTYTEAKGISFNCFSRHPITINDLEAVAMHQQTEMRHGDILLIRTGMTEDLTGLTGEQQLALLRSGGGISGIEGNEESAKWFWNRHFAAVAGDMIAFEVLPPARKDGSIAPMSELVLHEYFLSLFGLSIGELWSLKALSEYCARTKRYSFLLTSIPLNVPGGVGSPANAIALF